MPVEAILCNSDPLTKDRGLEGQRCKVALHLLYVVLTEELQVLNGAVLPVIYGNRPHLIEIAVEPTEIAFEVSRNGFSVGVNGAYALLGAPNLIDGRFDGGYQLRIHLILVVEKPGTFCGLRHITQNHYRVIEGVLTKVRLDAAIGR